MAIFYPVEGEPREVKPADGKSFTLKEMQTLVEGRIDILPLPSGLYIVVNDEGKLEGLEKNENATKLWMKEYPIEEYPDNNDELIVGPARPQLGWLPRAVIYHEPATQRDIQDLWRALAATAVLMAIGFAVFLYRTL